LFSLIGQLFQGGTLNTIVRQQGRDDPSMGWGRICVGLIHLDETAHTAFDADTPGGILQSGTLCEPDQQLVLMTMVCPVLVNGLVAI